jgi:hypothetical protein
MLDSSGKEVTFTVSSREKKKNEFKVFATFSEFKEAKDFANDLVLVAKHYEAQVINSNGVDVYNTRRTGITPRPRKKK